MSLVDRLEMDIPQDPLSQRTTILFPNAISAEAFRDVLRHVAQKSEYHVELSEKVVTRMGNCAIDQDARGWQESRKSTLSMYQSV